MHRFPFNRNTLVLAGLGLAALAGAVLFTTGAVTGQDFRIPDIPEERQSPRNNARPERANPHEEGVEARAAFIEEIEVPALEAGELVDFSFKVGQVVTENQLLGRLNDSIILNKIAEEEANLKIERTKAESDVNLRYAQATADVSYAEYERAWKANQKRPGAVSESELDKRRHEWIRAKFQIEQAQMEQKTAKLTVERQTKVLEGLKLTAQRHQILSPVSGLIAEMVRDKGEAVNPRDTVLKVVRLDQLKIEAYVHAKYYRPDLVGRNVTFTVTHEGLEPRSFQGRVTHLQFEFDTLNEEFVVEAEIENPNLWLRPGMKGSLKISPEPVANKATNTRLGRK